VPRGGPGRRPNVGDGRGASSAMVAMLFLAGGGVGGIGGGVGAAGGGVGAGGGGVAVTSGDTLCSSLRPSTGEEPTRRSASVSFRGGGVDVAVLWCGKEALLSGAATSFSVDVGGSGDVRFSVMPLLLGVMGVVALPLVFGGGVAAAFRSEPVTGAGTGEGVAVARFSAVAVVADCAAVACDRGRCEACAGDTGRGAGGGDSARTGVEPRISATDCASPLVAAAAGASAGA
jgi:hypothetical protein